jgi:hypothetical protein
MIQRAVQGMALFHVDSDHDAGYDGHALILKLRHLRELRLDHATIGQVRPVYRVYPSHDEKLPPERSKYPPPSYHYFIDVAADSPKDLENAFREMERIECHVDGFGF